MGSEALPLYVAAWTLTFLLHGTLLVAAAWVVAARVKSHAVRERLWKIAFAGAFVTATASLLAGDAAPTRGFALRTVEALRAPSAPPATLAHDLLAGDSGFLPGTERVDAWTTSAVRDPMRITEEAGRAVGAEGAAGLAGTEGAERALDPAAEPARPALASALDGSPIPRRAAPATTGFESATPAGPTATVSGLPGWALPIAALWALGAGIALVRWSLDWRRLARHLRDRRRIEPGLEGEARRAAAILAELTGRAGTRAVRLSSSNSLSSPISFGCFRPEICVPTRALSRELGLRDEELRALLAHELAHVVRRDPTWLALAGAVERLFFFQPLLGIVRRRWQDDAELCCDDWAVRVTGERLSLAACLTEVAGWIVRDPFELPVPGMAARGAGLGRRVRRLLETAPAPDARSGWLQPATLLALGGVAFGAPRIEAVRVDPQAATVEPARARDAATESESPRAHELRFDAPRRARLPEAADVEPEAADVEPEAADLEPEVADSELEVADSEPEVADSEPEVADSEPEIADLEPEPADVEAEVADEVGPDDVEPMAADSEMPADDEAEAADNGPEPVDAKTARAAQATQAPTPSAPGDTEASRVIGARATSADRTLPAPLPLGLRDTLTSLDRELDLLAREADALRRELAAGPYPTSWRDAARTRVESVLARVQRLRDQRAAIDALLAPRSPTDRAGRSPANATGPRSGPQPSR